MLENILAPTNASKASAKPVYCVRKEDVETLPEEILAWANANEFHGEGGSVLLVPNEGGTEISAALIGVKDDPFVTGVLAGKLPSGVWQIERFGGLDPHLASLGFVLGSYKFTRYKQSKQAEAKLLLNEPVSQEAIEREAGATFLVRNLINTPTNNMGPDEIENAARALAEENSAEISVIVGDDLLAQGFPMIHAVGRASAVQPRLIDMRWGDPEAPLLTLVGKGVAFDTGGVNIKPGGSMRNMKKDMGGAANILGLASMVMHANLNVRLRVLIPAVENSISGNAFRPGDILQSRKGLTVEIGHTDAEGRLVLADALTLACEEQPALIIDMATLTGAARVALGPEVSPYFSNDDGLAKATDHTAETQRDPLWRLPLWQNYNKGLSSTVADLNNVTTDGFAGSITAALFLQRFVQPETKWMHLDIFGWNPTTKPHAPIGGEAQGIRALFSLLETRFSKEI